MLRREFALAGDVARRAPTSPATASTSCHLNGQRVGDQLFTPGWTSYNKRLQYQTYDVTPLLKQGPNAVGAVLGNGWYRGEIGFRGHAQRLRRHRRRCSRRSTSRYADGTREVIISDGEWKAATGPILMSEIYHGETYDARLEQAGLERDRLRRLAAGRRSRSAQRRTDDLVAPAGPPVRRIEEIKPVKILKTPGGDTVVDLGQNMVGWVRLEGRRARPARR